jgi:hypothetical protein
MVSVPQPLDIAKRSLNSEEAITTSGRQSSEQEKPVACQRPSHECCRAMTVANASQNEEEPSEELISPTFLQG